MADTITDVAVPHNVWLDVTSIAGVTEGQSFDVSNVSRYMAPASYAWLRISSTDPGVDVRNGSLITTMDHDNHTYRVNAGESKVWLRSVSSIGTRVNLQPTVAGDTGGYKGPYIEPNLYELSFSGSEYISHSPWSPDTNDFYISLSYTPAAPSIGNNVIVWDNHINKDENDNFVFSYIDGSGVSQAVTLAALTIVAGTKYLIEITSNGSGVTLSAGGESASNAAVIDPSKLIAQNWMGN